jgi:hypothetical protein
MERTLNRATGIRRRVLWVALLLPLVGACGWFQGEPEGRARDFVETLVLDAANTARLNERAGLPAEADPQSVVHGLGVRVATDYLRMRITMGAPLSITPSRVERPDPRHQVVTVLARTGQAIERAGDEIAFRVSLERDEAGAWRIVRVVAGE